MIDRGLRVKLPRPMYTMFMIRAVFLSFNTVVVSAAQAALRSHLSLETEIASIIPNSSYSRVFRELLQRWTYIGNLAYRAMSSTLLYIPHGSTCSSGFSVLRLWFGSGSAKTWSEW
jgi:hypothetical protein